MQLERPLDSVRAAQRETGSDQTKGDPQAFAVKLGSNGNAPAAQSHLAPDRMIGDYRRLQTLSAEVEQNIDCLTFLVGVLYGAVELQGLFRPTEKPHS